MNWLSLGIGFFLGMAFIGALMALLWAVRDERITARRLTTDQARRQRKWIEKKMMEGKL